jgi:hypothetical protein
LDTKFPYWENDAGRHEVGDHFHHALGQVLLQHFANDGVEALLARKWATILGRPLIGNDKANGQSAHANKGQQQPKVEVA